METVNRVKQGVLALIGGSPRDALACLSSIDFGDLASKRQTVRLLVWGPEGVGRKYRCPMAAAKRQPTKTRDIRSMFVRDHYTCRYSHCRQPTLDPRVLALLSKAFPNLLPHHPNWRPIEQHILYWTYCTSIEHVISFPLGGDSRAENLVTSCYLCNDVKNYLPLEVLGWTLSPPAETPWLGLTEYLPQLRSAVARVGVVG